MQLLQRLLFGLRSHPVKLLDVVFHGLLDLARHGDSALLHLRAEGAIHELLAQRFAQLAIDKSNAALPAWLDLLHAAKRAAVEIEILLHELCREIRSVGGSDMPAQIGLPIGKAIGL